MMSVLFVRNVTGSFCRVPIDTTLKFGFHDDGYCGSNASFKGAALPIFYASLILLLAILLHQASDTLIVIRFSAADSRRSECKNPPLQASGKEKSEVLTLIITLALRHLILH